MISRLIAIDPFPRPGESDVIVYQIPYPSRAQELLEEIFNAAGIETVVIETKAKKPAAVRNIA